MDVLSNRVERSEIVAGDHIFSWRPLFTYAHHGIYIGDVLVIHFTAPPGKFMASSSILQGFSSGGSKKKTCPSHHPRCRSRKTESGVAIACLDCFIKKGSLYRYEYGVTKSHLRLQLRGGTCTIAQSDPASHVVQRANYLYENGFGKYNLLRNNCEDFATYCKTGILIVGAGRSGQIGSLARKFPETAAALLSSSKETSVEERACKFRMDRYAADIGVRDDVIKVPVQDMDKFHRGLMPAESCTKGEIGH